jgi:hypothetical protein
LDLTGLGNVLDKKAQHGLVNGRVGREEGQVKERIGDVLFAQVPVIDG